MVINIFLLKSNAMKIIGEIDDKPKIILFINFIVCLVHMKRCHTSPSYIIKHWICRKCLWNEMILLNNKSENFGIQSISICWCVKAIVFIGWKMSGFNSWCDWIFESRRNVLVWIQHLWQVNWMKWRCGNCFNRMTPTTTGTNPANDTQASERMTKGLKCVWEKEWEN